MRRLRTGSPADLLVVGLGNPGERYAKTRHNVGAEVVELLAKRYGGRLKRSKERALVAEVRLDGQRVVLAVPTTFMNTSGESVAPLVRRHGVTLDQLVVVHDDMDLPVAKLRIRRGSGTGGHRGLDSIVANLRGRSDFVRVRLGVGRPPGTQDPADYVLRIFGSADREAINIAIVEAADAVEMVLSQGVDAAMNHYN